MGNRAGLSWRAHVARVGANHGTDNTQTVMQAWLLQKDRASAACGIVTIGTSVTFAPSLQSAILPSERAFRSTLRSPHTATRSLTLQVSETEGTSS